MVEWRIFSSSPRRGGCAIKKKSRSILSSRRRGGVQPPQNSVEFDHHPVRSIKEASRYFIEVAATPSSERRGKLRTSVFGQQPLQPAFCLGFWTECSESERGLKPATTLIVLDLTPYRRKSARNTG